jgi:hypothetical protein
MASNTRRAYVPPAAALKLFRIADTASLRELNHSYRRLVRKYHPDYNAHRPKWAHAAMIRINAAYDSAVEYLSALRYEEIQRHLEGEIRKHDEFSRVFDWIADGVLDGVFTFYQYGLENPYARQSGTPRLRYRRAVQQISTGIDQLRKINAPNELDQETLDLFRTFVEAFYEVMRIKRAGGAPSRPDERAALNHYLAGSRMMDETIRKAFFREEFARPRDFASPQNLSVSLSEFMAVVTKYSKSSWITETALKLCLLDSFQRLCEIEERIPGLRRTEAE